MYSGRGIEGPSECRVLCDQLDQQNEPVVRVRQGVALALGSNGDGELVDELIKALSTDTSAQVRWRAALSRETTAMADDTVPAGGALLTRS